MKTRVAELSQKRGWGINKLTEETGLSSATTNNYWHHKLQRTDFAVLAKLARTLGVRPLELLDDSDEV